MSRKPTAVDFHIQAAAGLRNAPVSCNIHFVFLLEKRKKKKKNSCIQPFPQNALAIKPNQEVEVPIFQVMLYACVAPLFLNKEEGYSFKL